MLLKNAPGKTRRISLLRKIRQALLILSLIIFTSYIKTYIILYRDKMMKKREDIVYPVRIRPADIQKPEGLCGESRQAIDPVCYFLCDNFIFEKKEKKQR